MGSVDLYMENNTQKESVMNEYNPQTMPHPCETILEKIEEMNIGIAEFVSQTGLLEETMMSIINGQGSITLDVATSLERTTNIPIHFWLNLQRNYDDCNEDSKHTRTRR